VTVLFITEALAKAHVKGYTKADGTVVPAHDDKRVAAHHPAKWSAAHHSIGSSQGSMFGQSHKAPPKAFHPQADDAGKKVGIYEPHALDLSGLGDPDAVVTFTPGCTLPDAMGGISLSDWTPPENEADWFDVAGVADIEEPPMETTEKQKESSGLVIMEDDGRVWVVSPTNKFGGYKNTFPKGKQDDELSLQANAIKEAWEESGIKAEVVAFLGDQSRTSSKCRYYLARRVAGNPAAMGWESQAVHLVPTGKLRGFLDTSLDREVMDMLVHHLLKDA
jgi:8-oxo-dGTP pyrophosphatase MutT (NUDIX family)